LARGWARGWVWALALAWVWALALAWVWALALAWVWALVRGLVRGLAPGWAEGSQRRWEWALARGWASGSQRGAATWASGSASRLARVRSRRPWARRLTPEAWGSPPRSCPVASTTAPPGGPASPARTRTGGRLRPPATDRPRLTPPVLHPGWYRRPRRGPRWRWRWRAGAARGACGDWSWKGPGHSSTPCTRLGLGMLWAAASTASMRCDLAVGCRRPGCSRCGVRGPGGGGFAVCLRAPDRRPEAAWDGDPWTRSSAGSGARS